MDRHDTKGKKEYITENWPEYRRGQLEPEQERAFNSYI